MEAQTVGLAKLIGLVTDDWEQEMRGRGTALSAAQRDSHCAEISRALDCIGQSIAELERAQHRLIRLLAALQHAAPRSE